MLTNPISALPPETAVIMESNYSYQNLFGKLEYENYYGSLKTDYTMLKPGLMHKANGGYIIFQAKDLLSNPVCYEELKRVLRIKLLGIDNVTEQRSSMAMISLKPEPIPLNLKVILVGAPDIYHLLYDADDEFSKLFKVKVEFEEEVDNTEANRKKLISFISAFCEKDNTLHFAPSGVAAVLQYASQIADDQGKLSTRYFASW